MDYVLIPYFNWTNGLNFFSNARSTIISITPNFSSDRKEQDKEQERTLTTITATTIFRSA
jgi:hypothetical protein